ncbi:MAG: recombinase family protein [Pedobacter sp.]
MIAAVYIRKSREDKNKPSHRLTVQREQLPAYASSQGWQVEVYDDGHASAAKGKVEDLRERARLESDVRAGKIGMILVIELSRLSRDDTLADYLSWLNLCAEHGVKLATPSRSLDPKQHSDWMLLLMEGGFSSVEMKVLQARMAEGRREALRAGKWLGGKAPPPYRYDRNTGEVEIDTDQLAECQHIWQLAETNSAKAIAEQLGRAEISIRRIISDDRLLFYQALRKDPETGDIVAGSWTPVMDAEQADRIRSSRRTRKTNGVKREAAALLSNLDLLRCGYCDLTVKTWRNSRTRNDGTRIDYYGCRSKNTAGACDRSRMIPQHTLNERVLTNLFGTLSSTDKLKTWWHASQSQDTTSEQLAAIDREEHQEQQRKNNLVAAIADGILRMEDARAKMQDIEASIGALRERRRKIEATRPDQPDWDALSITREEFDLLSETEQRKVLSVAITKVSLYSSYALITYPFPRNAAGEHTARIHLPAAKKGPKAPTKSS